LAAGATYYPIATTTLGSAQSSVTFSSISGSYTDLVLVISGKEDVATGAGFGYVLGMQYNSDTGSNYSVTRLDGNGSSAASDRFTNQTSFDIGYYGGTGYTGFSTSIIQIMNYSNSTTYKTMLNRMALPASGHVTTEVGLWRSTSAITSIKVFFTDSNNIAAGSTFTLYGITAA
jgi:hypothetical protein